MADAVVTIAGLVKRYRNLVALDGIDLTITRGEICGLIGPNGAGKTTLIRSAVGASHPTSGHIEVLGFDPFLDRWALRSRIGYMPQLPALYPDLSVRNNVAFFAAGHRRGNNGRDVETALELVELTDRADDPVRHLSGGMTQRVSLACAVVHGPELLFLDEPTAGIDPELRAAFWRSFRRMAEAGTTVIVSTHQMSDAAQCDRVALLRHGRIIANDDPTVLFAARQAKVRTWANGRATSVVLADYATQLPALLRDRAIDRLEIEFESADEVVLRLIAGSGL